MTTIQAAVLRTVGEPLQIEDLILDSPAPGEVVVRIAGVGICHTDVSCCDGTMPRPLPTVLGHEGSGIVEAVGATVTCVKLGDHVVLSYDHCGSCDNCRRGLTSYCDTFVLRNYSGARLDGTLTLAAPDGTGVHGSWLGQSSFATHVIANQHSAVSVNPELPIELLGPLGCGLLTGAGAVLNVLRPRPRDSIAIFGLGAVGLSAVMAARAAECDPIIAIDPVTQRRALARELGATQTAAELGGLAPAPGLHHAVDAVGAGAVIHTALKALRSTGTCVTLGFRGNRHEISIDQSHLLFGRTLRGSVEGDASPQAFIPQLLDMQANGDFPFERLLTTYPFDRLNDAIDDVAAGRVVKPVVLLH